MLGLGLDPFTAARPAGLGTAALPPLLISPPSVEGSGVVGTQLAGSIGVWVPRPGQAFAWSWQRDGADIPGANGSGDIVAPYTVASSDHGAALRLRVSATTTAGESVVYSDSVLGQYPAPVALVSGWTLPLGGGEAITPVPLARAFSGMALTFSVDPAADPLPAGLVLDAAGTLSGTPPAGDAVAGVRIIASNPGGSATLDLTLDVRAPAFVADYVAGTYALNGGAADFATLHSFARPGIGTRLTAAGQIEEVPADQPRFDHDAAGVPLGLLIEGDATNRLTGSEDLVTGWTASLGSASPAGLSVRGRWGGMVVTSNGNGASRLSQTLPVVQGETVEIKVYCMPGSSGRLRVQLRNPLTGDASRVRGPFGALAVVMANAGPVEELVERVAADGVVEVSLIHRPAFTGDLEIGFGPDSTVAGDTLLLLAAQTTRGSYVPTGATAATRPADQIGLNLAASGLFDLSLTHDDDSGARLEGLPLDPGGWPELRRPWIRRLVGHSTPRPPLTLENDTLLRLEGGVALTLEIPA
ncbi:MAG: hypothetical protein KatS3mg118_0218 [Paracoccaceae bacterium]|nr:MAG: hypothetical protein KatS3mg118_0218 [Paracoccaceae bacterium]